MRPTADAEIAQVGWQFHEAKRKQSVACLAVQARVELLMAGHEAAVRAGRDVGRLPGAMLSALLKSALSQEVTVYCGDTPKLSTQLLM